MSIFLIGKGIQQTRLDLEEDDNQKTKEIISKFHSTLINYAQKHQVSASILKVLQSSYLFIAKDHNNFNFIIADKNGLDTIISDYITSSLDPIIKRIESKIGDVLWIFKIPHNLDPIKYDNYVNENVRQYVMSTIEAQHANNKNTLLLSEITLGIEKFRNDYPIGTKTAFIIMKFENTSTHNEITKCIKEALNSHGITALRADDKEYLDDLFLNIKTYMHVCDFGIAVLEHISEDNFNPNVSFEIGYMFGVSKNVLLLKDKTLKSLHADLAGKLYKEFDTQDIQNTLPIQIEKWLKDKGLI